MTKYSEWWRTRYRKSFVKYVIYLSHNRRVVLSEHQKNVLILAYLNGGVVGINSVYDIMRSSGHRSSVSKAIKRMHNAGYIEQINSKVKLTDFGYVIAQRIIRDYYKGDQERVKREIEAIINRDVQYFRR